MRDAFTKDRTRFKVTASNGRLRYTRLIAIVCLALPGEVTFAQDAPADTTPIRIFIDCNNTPCDSDFFRTEILSG